MKQLRLTIVMGGLIAAATAAASARGAAPPWPDAAYRVEWTEAHLPAEVATGVRIAVPMAIVNTGNRAWPATQVFVSYHWLRDGRLIVWDGDRTALPRDLRAGSRSAVAARVTTPDEPGDYVLQLTLVHELVTWFEHRGATMNVHHVSVRRPAQLSSCAPGATPCATP